MKQFFFIFLIFQIGFSARAQRAVVAIGDSNGTSEIEWVGQLQRLRSQDSIFNYSISGNTIGFDNRKNEKLNTLRNVDRYLADAISRSPENRLDDIILLIGTNDCKRVYEDSTQKVIENLQKLITSIQNNENVNESTNVYIVTPPPMGPDSMLLGKYQGGDQRIRSLLPGFLEVSLNSNCYYIDVYSDLKSSFAEFNIDGIHLNEKGSVLVARRISSFLDKTAPNRWDNEDTYIWPDAMKEVNIISPLDSAVQRAYFYASSGKEAQPLIVSLHTWSGNYTQRDPLVSQILEKDWNYIHPDFRGRNNTPKALGSAFAIDDIDQAIQYAINKAKVSPSSIHIIGASGGGYATLFSFMNSKHDIASFSAWVPISDIEAWYHQSMGRKNQYAGHILKATQSPDSILNVKEARKRSPLYMKTPVQRRNPSSLTIYAGIHDGYEGSVPISQSINFYNKVINDFGADEGQTITEAEIIDLLGMRTYPKLTNIKIGGRQIIFQRTFKNIKLVLFEGNHEMLSDVALELLSDED
jgi:lysophospholipase L1-like esterase/esterase/lipase